METDDLSGEILKRHSAFMGSLARELLRDPHLAEDASQEALLASLHRPPPAHVNPMAWLATLTRRAALGMRRGAARRQQREAAVARADSVPSAVEGLARADSLLRVAQVVVGLPEPYRSTVLERYYEGRTPSEIAERQGVPVATVKSRLTRAHAHLRERLDRAAGGRGIWRTDLAALCGLPDPSLLAKVVVLKTSSKLLWASVALLAGGTSWWLVRDPAAPAPAGVDDRASPLALVEADSVSPPPPPDSEPQAPPAESRSALESAETPAALDSTGILATEARPDLAILLHGFVLPAEEGASLEAETTVALTDAAAVRRKSEADLNGAYSFPLLPPGRYWLDAGSDANGRFRAVVDLDAAQKERRLDIQLEPPQRILVEVVDRAGEPVTGLPLLAVATLTPPGDWVEELAGSWNNPFGAGTWDHNGLRGIDFPKPVLGCVRITAPPPLCVSLLHFQRVVETQRVDVGQGTVRFVVDPESPILQRGRLRMRVIDAVTRQPLPPSTRLMFQFASAMSSGRLRDDGVYEAGYFPGWLGVSIQNGKESAASLWTRIEPGVVNDLGDVLVEPAVSISGRVLDDRGAGLAIQVRHELEGAAPPAVSRLSAHTRVSSRADGSFAITGLARGRYRLSVADPNQEFATQSEVVDASAGSVEGVCIRLVRGTPLIVSSSDDRWRAVRFELVDPEGTHSISSGLNGPEPRKLVVAPGLYELAVRVGDAPPAPRTKLMIGASPISIRLP